MRQCLDIRGAWFAAIIIVLTGALLCTVLPNDYRTGADEGTYFRQGSALLHYGVAGGYAHIAHDYISTPAQHQFPNPLRVGMIAVVALALHFDAGYAALSCVSIAAFMLLLAGVWWFVGRYWDRSLALATLVLLAASPLALALARRALMDSLSTTTAAASLFAFYGLLDRPGRRSLVTFVAAMTVALLVKETAVLLLPFYAAVMLWLWWRDELSMSFWQIAVALCVAPLVAVCAWLAAYGFAGTLAIVVIVPQVASTATAYTVNYGSGPWFRYLIDFITLSPWVFLLAVAGMGSALLKGTDRWTGVMLLLAFWMLLVYAPLTKNARYVELLVLPLRFFAAGMVLSLLRRWWSPPHKVDGDTLSWSRLRQPACWLPIVLFALLAGRDVGAFHRNFIVGGIYDPVTYNLLRANNILPGAQPAHKLQHSPWWHWRWIQSEVP